MFECPAQSDAGPVADIDLAIDKVSMFRLERMDDGVIWIRLYREGGEDKIIWLNSPSAISARVEDDKDAQSDAEPVRAFARAVLHGDDEHKAWLLEAGEAFIAGKPLPAPRGKGTALAQSDAEPVAWPDIDAAVKAGLATRNPAPDAAPSSYSNIKTVTIGGPALAQSDAEPYSGISWSGFNIRGDRKSIDAVRDALHAKDRCEALDKMISEKQLVRPNASAGLIEAAELTNDQLDAAINATIDYVNNNKHTDYLTMQREGLRAAILSLRARAADRSGK